MKQNISNDIIDWFESDTISFIDKVLADDKDNPEYSAVTCNNRIIALIRLERNKGEKYKSVEEYLYKIGYSEKDIQNFISKKNKEITYYQGEIYALE